MRESNKGLVRVAGILMAALAPVFMGLAFSQQAEQKTSYSPVDIREDFESILSRMRAAKAEVMSRQMALLAERYDLTVGERDCRPAVRVRHVDVGEELGVLLEEGGVLLQPAGDVLSFERAQSRSLPRTPSPQARSYRPDCRRRSSEQSIPRRASRP